MYCKHKTKIDYRNAFPRKSIANILLFLSTLILLKLYEGE
ncbi:hypothetical protein MNB_SV-3-150 [hydrothermal vent metagenome]|uniref:Uncharacterized protein n=1 Tax=hydrothermal vent metagenome TaxID=652676 RepID=A0A1W1BQU8_9ZZZZ